MKSHILTVAIALVAGFLGAYAYALTDAASHYPGSDYFEDIAVDSPHNDDIGFAVEAGITMGLTPDVYGSDVGVTREQMASFQMRDLAASVALTLALAREMHFNDWEIHGAPPRTPEERADLLRWAATLLEYENTTRPADAAGGPTVYGYLAQKFRDVAHVYDPIGD